MQMDNTGKIEVMIQCSHVEKTFFTRMTSTPVIRDLDLKVRKNEFVVLFGPGQCGKTTVLNVMAGLETATSGTVTVNGKEVSTPGPDRGFVYQTTALFPWYTVMQNVEYGPRARGMSKKERREKAQYYIDLVGLQGFEDKFPNQLSGGMQQRVALARALAYEATSCSLAPSRVLVKVVSFNSRSALESLAALSSLLLSARRPCSSPRV